MPFISNVTSMLGFETIPEEYAKKGFYELKAELPGKTGAEPSYMEFNELKGKPVLIVNTASKCGYTPQYTGLEDLHKQYADKGLVVLGFPCNQFAGQEPGDDDAIASFCQKNHGVTFPLMKKSDVNGKHMNEVFAWLKSHGGPNGGGIGGTTAIKWNFTKFLVNSQGEVIGRYGPSTKPEQLKEEIDKLLQ